MNKKRHLAKHKKLLNRPGNATHHVLAPLLSSAFRDVVKERHRQQVVKGFSAEQDDTYTCGELAAAAISYIEPVEAESYWPVDWHDDSFKPSDNRRNLVKAAALLIAEIERLDRVIEGGS